MYPHSWRVFLPKIWISELQLAGHDPSRAPVLPNLFEALALLPEMQALGPAPDGIGVGRQLESWDPKVETTPRPSKPRFPSRS